MAEKIEVEFDGTENLSAVTKKATKGVDKLEKSIEKTDKALAKVEKEAKPAAKAIDSVGDASEDAAGGLSQGAAAAATFAGNLAASAVDFAVEKIKELSVAVGEFVLATSRGRRAAKGLLAQVADSPAELSALFEGLSNLAIDTGGEVGDLSSKFVELRKEGRTAQQALDLLKLRADLGHDTDVAAEAMADYSKAIEDGASHADAIDKVAEKFRVAGDGTKAAAATATTWDGALAKAKATIAKALGPALDKAGPAIEKLADAMVKFAESGALEDTLMAVADAMSFVASNGKTISTMFSALSFVASPVSAALSLVGGAFDKLGTSFTEVGAMAAKALVAVTSTVSGWVSAGGDMVDGFIKGIKAKAKAAVAAAKEMGSEALASLKAILKSSSPSKAAAAEGENLSAGFEQGIEPVDAGANLMPEGLSASIGDVSGEGAASGNAAGNAADGISIESLVINASGANTPEEYVTLTRRAFVEAFNDMQLSRGVAL